MRSSSDRRMSVGKKMMGGMRLSGCLGDNEDAHEEDHDEEDPHEKPIHHLGHLLPLCHLHAGSSLLAEAVGDELDVLHHLRKRRTEQVKRNFRRTKVIR